jgi:hypothetical protein
VYITGSGSCPVVVFRIRGVESGSTIEGRRILRKYVHLRRSDAYGTKGSHLECFSRW